MRRNFDGSVFWLVTALILIFIGVLYLARAKAAENTIYNFGKVEFIRCRDGDTCLFNLPNVHPLFGKNIPVRFAGVDAPEKSAACMIEAIQAERYVTSMLAQATTIELVAAKRGKYYRIVAGVVVDGVNLNEQLLKRKLALPYNGKSKPGHPCLSKAHSTLRYPYS